ncbi:hypothetical protein Y032_0273g1001 [Ancylostoma ceylanicum]|uniref:Uncharacterized protein n=1 Tax=Ancylostoma ceylanicum TaxID=53326 RepID=A0A016S8X7_9BILA|nr:hypothetical protein Y032_0273g1001 [Ancylostoma ceylanicum]
MWLLIALASVAQTVLCEDITQDQNKTCTRSAISVKAYGKAAKIPFPSGEQPKDKNKTDPSHENTSNFTLRLETMTVREGNGDPVIVQRLTGLDNDGAVRSMAEFSILDKGKGKHTILLPGRFDDFVKRCTVVRMHKMSGAYVRNVKMSTSPSTGTATNRMNQNNMRGSQKKQYQGVSGQRYGAPNNYYQQYGTVGNNYRKFYMMKQLNSNYGQLGSPSYPKYNPSRNLGNGNPGYGYPHAPNYGNYNPYAPMQGRPSYNENYLYGQNTYRNHQNNPNTRNSQFNSNPGMQNPARLNTNLLHSGTSIRNQQASAPNQVNLSSIPQSLQQVKMRLFNPNGKFVWINQGPNTQSQTFSNNPSHFIKQTKPGRHGSPIEHPLPPEDPNDQLSNNKHVEGSIPQFTFTSSNNYLNPRRV